MNGTLIILLIALAVLAFTALIVWAYCNEKEKFRRGDEALREIASSLKGHCLDQGTWKYPQVLVDHEGLRTRIDFAEQNLADATGTAAFKVKRMQLSTDGFDPKFKLSVNPKSLSAKADAWFSGNRCESGRNEFDGKFVVASNRFQNSMNYVISPEVAGSILNLSEFSFEESPGNKKDKGSPENNPDPLEDKRLDRERKIVLMKFNQQKTIASSINKQRFKFSFDGGMSKFQLLIHDSELDKLKDYVLALLDIQRRITTNVKTLERAEVKKNGRV